MTRKFLEELGITEKDAVDKIMAENGADIENARKSERTGAEKREEALQQQLDELQEQAKQRDKDLTGLQGKLEAAKADTNKLTEAQEALTELQAKYDADMKEWESKSKRQAYEFMVKEKANTLEFTSSSAKRTFIEDAIKKEFKTENDKLLGFDDFVNAYKETDPGAFKTREEGAPEGKAPAQVGTPPQIVLPQGQAPEADKNAFNFSFTGVRPFKANN